MSTSVPEIYALLPLTVFDKMFERTTFVTGWLVEGKIHASAFTSALDSVTQKWRMLAGRLQSVKEGEVRYLLYSKLCIALISYLPLGHQVAFKDTTWPNTPRLPNLRAHDVYLACSTV